MNEQIEIVSVKGGKYHRPDDTLFSDGGHAFRDARLMRCGRSLVPLNLFQTIADADKYTGGRLDRYICQHCERKIEGQRPITCECDNTHEQNDTCCMPCWNAGFRVAAEASQ